MKRLSKEPETTVACRWEAIDDDGYCYWKGYCEGDKDGQCLDELTLSPKDFIGHIITEHLHVCPDCGVEAFMDEQGWYCPHCDS